jgi:hypothetical protein
MTPDRATWMEMGLELDRAGGVALDIEPAGALTPAWSQLLGEYKVPALSEDARFAAAQQRKQLKGAPLPEVEAVFNAICGPAASDLCAQACARYQQLATERPKKMFAHAMAAAQQHRYDEYAPGAYVLRCPSCGAPRLKAKLHCDFCGAAIK